MRSDDVVIWGMWAILLLSAALLCVGVVVAAKDSAAEKAQWDVYSEENDCRVVEVVKGTVTPVTGFSTGGQMVVGSSSTPTRRVYECSDGMRHTR